MPMTRANEKVRCLSRYELLRQLGQGKLTRTFLAARLGPDGAQLERLGVLGLLHEELAHDDDFRALFLDRAARSLALAHPGLVHTEEVVADSEGCGVSLEYLDGQPLSRVLARLGRNRFPVDIHLHLLGQVLAALEHAHSGVGHGGFVHRNVCPSNIFLTYDGRIKLLGTGFADVLAALERKLREPVVDIRYAAPEVLLGAPAEPSADLFSVGVMLWEAIMQQQRLFISDPQLIMTRRTSGHEPDLERAWPEAPDSLIELCGRALAREPETRHTSAGQLRAVLDVYLARATQPSPLVLGRLPALLQTAFASEREEMQLFIGASLQGLRGRVVSRAGARSEASARLGALLEADPEPTPHDDEWRAETSKAWPKPAGSETLEAGSVRDAAPASAEGPPSAGPPSPPSSSSPPRPSRPSGPPSPPRPRAAAAPGNAPLRGDAAAAVPDSESAPAPSGAPPSERRDTDTGGHRAFSATWPSSPAASARAPMRRGGALLLAMGLAGALGASTALVRHSAKRTTSNAVEGTAVAARGATRHTGGATGGAPPAGAGAAATSDDRALLANAAPGDAGAPPLPPAPAFFDGRAAAPRHPEPTLRTLSLDDLPAVDESRESLQRAVLRAARKRRLALRRKLLEKAAPEPPPERWSEPSAPRAIDEADPYASEVRE
jgi:eukaryotic-like serine/threonine-protein kinase